MMSPHIVPAGALFENCGSTGPSKEALTTFQIGPGDVLHVQVADLREFEKLAVRVDGDGKIDLPLIGTLKVAGMNEDQVRQAISDQVSDYVRHPRVHVFVSQYHSRSVAVMGMVAKPGAYSLAGPSDSILDMIGRAGGMKEGAAQRVVFFPIETNGDVSGARALITSDGVCANKPYNRNESFEEPPGCKTTSPHVAASAARNEALDSLPLDSRVKGSPIVIDLTKPAFAGCLDVPARPGDVVLVPAAGQVGVYGWVEKPGSFDVAPGMTVLGAVSAAGGATFSSNAEILRTTSDSDRTMIPLDLSSIEHGDERDIPVEAGDLILVRASALGLLPYSLSKLWSKFGSGMYFPPP